MIYQQNLRQQSNGNELKLFFFDMDGTLYLGDRLFDGAAEFVTKLRKKGVRTIFLSNNSSKNRKEYFEKLRRMKFEPSLDEIFTSLSATILKLKKDKIKKLFPLGTPAFEEELLENGFEFSDDFPEVVLLGFDKTINYRKIDCAYQHLAKGVRYIATHPDVLCPAETGYNIDIGAFISMFEKATGRMPEIIGKPNVEMVSEIMRHFNLSSRQCAMVGDRLYTDMKMAIDADLTSILVLSGETKYDDYKKSGMNINIVADDVRDLTVLFNL